MTHRRWALRATPPLLYQPGKRELAYLYGDFSSVNPRCPHPPVGFYTEDEDTNDTHEEQGVTVTTTDPRNLHLSRAEVIPRYNDLLQVVKLFKRSPTKYDMYLQMYVEEDTGQEFSLILDRRTRWNNLLAMIERFHKLKVCIDKALIDIGSDTKFSDLEWSKIKDLIESLKPFKLAVEALCRRD
ncbi:hypothetical protein AVEN_121113-1 [Araneus ventricosus]|uniref:Uncharacterized protein n=1 Tax=Araneus ventricosus TaxID=182803 RepID=A0A4Y2KTJ3_ARAVE|nr:hypothetical protein AVEN_121113-1 [Araneus ventricosus]